MTSSPDLPTPLRFSVVGPGRVGSSLAHWIVAHGGTLKRVAGRNIDSARELAAELSATAVEFDRLTSIDDDLLLIAVSDSALEEVAVSLARRPQAKVVLHTSGRAAASILAPLRIAGSTIGSIHPLRAFPRTLTECGTAEGTVFALDGDGAATTLARRLVAAWGGVAVEVPPEARPLYHLAATLAAGGITTLLASAYELADRLGLPPEIKAGYLHLALGALHQVESTNDVAAAITGPVARGDLEGFEAQLRQLRKLDEDLADLIEKLAARTLHHRPTASDP